MKKIIKISKSLSFDNDKRPLLIAEISGNHNGSKKQFLNHIKAAHKSGADLIKIQTYEPQDITVYTRKFKIKSGIWKGKDLWSLYNKAQTPIAWHKEAFSLAKKLGAILFSSPFSSRGVDLLEKYIVKLYKLASLEITDFKLINKIAKTRKPIIISTGSAKMQEIKNCLKIIKKYHNKIIILHCVSDYPTKNKNANIKKIKYLKKIFKNELIGLSDHTTDIFSSVSATALGAVVIEKHFKTSNRIRSLDEKFSITPEKFKLLKKFTTKVSESLSSSKVEKLDKQKYRRSIFASKLIRRGERFTEKNINTLRPFIGLCASNYYKILNKKSKKNISKNSPIFKMNVQL